MPERTPTGQLPRSIQVVLENDLVDRVKPGDRVKVTGVYKCMAGKQAATNGIFKTMIVAIGIQSLNLEKEKPIMSEVDLRNIKTLSKEKKLFDILGGSVAPSI